MVRLVSTLLILSAGCASSGSSSAPTPGSRHDAGDDTSVFPDVALDTATPPFEVADADDIGSLPEANSDSGAKADSDSGSGATDSGTLGDTGVATSCPTGVLPPDGGACAVSLNEYCRLGSCSGGCEAECRCTGGHWKCGPTCRDKYGCGTPPSCRDTPCP